MRFGTDDRARRGSSRTRASVRNATSQSPSHADCIHALDALLVRQQRRSEAGQLVDDWLRREPRSASAYAEYGWVCACDKDYPRALSACQHAYELDPHDVHALLLHHGLFDSPARAGEGNPE